MLTYKVFYYQNSKNQQIPVQEYINELPTKDRAKVFTYIELLRDRKGVLDQPYSKFIRSGIRELRVDFSKNRHRIFYVTVESKKIIFLHSFLKKTQKTPKQHITKALNNYQDYKRNKKSIQL